jgi:hypothetical protein
MKRFAIAAGLLTLTTGMACGSSSTGPSGSHCDPCTDGGSSGIAPTGSGHNANPDGVAYPSPAVGYGHLARAGATPGSIIANYKFLGYPDPTKAGGALQTISLADYYDPCQKRYKMIHVTVAGVWCNPCNMETKDLVANEQTLAADKIVVLQAIDDGGTEGIPATQTDLNYWITVHGPSFTEMLDPGNHNLGVFFNANAIPWNAEIDPRTMEILTSGVGAVAAMDVINDLAIVAQPPGYTIPAGLCP